MYFSFPKAVIKSNQEAKSKLTQRYIKKKNKYLKNKNIVTNKKRINN